jgi:hypothetical protein
VIHSNRDRNQRPAAGLQERGHNGTARLQDGDRTAGRGRLHGEHRARKGADVFVVVGIAGGRDLDADSPVGGAPAAGDLLGQVVERDRLGLEQIAHVVEIELERHGEDGFDALALRRLGHGERRHCGGRRIVTDRG